MNPNLAREWGETSNPGEYVQFLGKAYRAIKAANPSALVINAGMAPTGDNSENAMPDDLFYEQMYQAMGSSNGYFDALGVHGAGYAALSWIRPSSQQPQVWRLSLFCLPPCRGHPPDHGEIRRQRQRDRAAGIWLDL
jgi:hypothetical protein